MQTAFGDTALVVLGHGGTKNRDSGASVALHARALRERGDFAEVREAYWKQDPQVINVVKSLRLPRIVLVPFFTSEGYFSRVVIPEALGFPAGSSGEMERVQVRENQVWHYAEPVGTHPGMTAVLLERAASVVRQFPFPRLPAPKDTTLFVAGHGTERDSNSRASIESQVATIARSANYAAVHAVFMEEAPRIADCYELARTRHIVVVPFFVSDGLHVCEDIPVMLGEAKSLVMERLAAGQPVWRNPTEKRGKLVWYAPSVGSHPLMAELILGRARAVLEQAPVRPM